MRFYIIYVIFFTSIAAYAQSAKGINISLKDVRFKTFVNKIESSYNYHFYYDEKETDSLTISITVNNATIQKLLSQIFDGTNFKFAIDESNRVFISREFKIITNLPKEIFGKQIDITDSSANNNFLFSDEPVIKQKLKISEESKLLIIGNQNESGNQKKQFLAGYVKDARNGETIAGATLQIDSSANFVTTDQFGYYTISLPKGKHEIRISSAGMTDTKREIQLYSSGKLNIELQEYVASLKNVVVNSEKKSNVRNLQMGTTQLTIKSIKQVPTAFGEVDVLKVVLALPGVTSVGEASNGFNVRGGSTDQNLILFNDATIYNPSHLFGFFSAFNPDVVKGIELYKSAIPERYGGRLSSVLDVTMKDGNTKKWSGVGGIGPLTSRFTFEGPINKEKTSIIIGGRTTYSNWLLHSLKNVSYNKSDAAFSDFNLHLTHNLNSKNTIYLTGYYSTDNFDLNNDTTYKYSNKNINFKWKHIFNNSFNAIVSTGVDSYNYSVSSSSVPINAYQLKFGINQINLKSTFNYSPNYKHTIDFGINSTYYQLKPGAFNPVGSASLVTSNVVPNEQALETALFLGDQITISPKLSINGGLRYSIFNYFGPKEVYGYANGMPRTINNITDSTFYTSGKIIKTYLAPEVRLSLRYALSGDASIKASYNTLVQFIHLLSNTTAISPTDIWKLSDTYIQPQNGEQFSFGIYKNFKSNVIETSLEVYYKRTEHFLDYKSGASLLLNKHIETDVVNTKGKAYGIELLIKKTSGRINGWLSYSYSRTFLKQDDPIAGETINKGDWYPASFDKPHSLNFIGNYQFSHRYNISANFVYSTGRPITLPLAVFNIGGASALYYSDRNQYRVPDYIRADLSINIDGNHKVKQLIHNSWSVGVYNLLGRQNVYSVYFSNVNGHVKGYQLSIFGSAIPFITYNFRF